MRTPGFILALLIALALGTSGCGGPDIDGYCLALENCRGGNDADIDACVAASQYKVEIADTEGCTEEYEAYFACFFDKADCNTSDTTVKCATMEECTDEGYSFCKDGTCHTKMFNLDEPKDCDAERNAYGNCQ